MFSRSPFLLSFPSSCLFTRSLLVDVALFGECFNSICSGIGGEELYLGTSAIGVGEETLDFGLDFGGKEVSLDGRDAFWGLGGDNVDSYYAAPWLGAFDRYLCPSLIHILLSFHLQKGKPRSSKLREYVPVTNSPAHSPLQD